MNRPLASLSYGLLVGVVAGLGAVAWLERTTIAAIATELAQQGAGIAGQLVAGAGRWYRDEPAPEGAEPPLPVDEYPSGSLPPDPPARAPSAPAPMPQPSGMPAGTGLDGLFAALRRSDSAEAAQRIEAEIFLRLSRSGSPTVDLMMNSAAVTAADDGQQAAREIYRRVTRIEPGFAEGWARLAGAAFEAGDLAAAERDLRIAVRLEPRHYAAWTGLGAVLEASGDPQGAARAYREALFLNPWQDSARRGLLRAETASLGLPM